MNPENCSIPRKYGSLRQTTKQPLSNFEPQKLWKYKQLWGLSPDSSCLQKNKWITLDKANREPTATSSNIYFIYKNLLAWGPQLYWRRDSDSSGLLEQGGAEGSSARPPESFLLMCPFFRRALEVPFLKEITKNVHEN